MTESEIVSPPKRRTHTGWLIAGGVALGIALGFLLVAALAVRAGMHSPLAALFKGRSTTIDTSTPSVVDKIRQLSRLETVGYSIDKIVEGSHQARGIPDFLAGDRLLFIAHGEVTAGVDLAQLGANDVRIVKGTVYVHVPAPQILVTRIDNSRSRVYERNTGVLVLPDPGLESQVRQAAEQQITQAAIDDNILDKARQNARVSVTGLLYALGFRNVYVQ